MKKVISILAIISLLIGSAYADHKVENENNKKTVATTSFKGIVLDKNTGEALVGVKVVISELDLTVYTDLDGNFEFENVIKKTYHIDSEMISYKTQDTKINLNESGDLKIVMENK